MSPTGINGPGNSDMKTTLPLILLVALGAAPILTAQPPPRMLDGDLSALEIPADGEFPVEGRSPDQLAGLIALDRLLRLPPEELDRLAATIERIQQMPPEQREALHARVRQFLSEHRDEARQGLERLRELPPEKRRELRQRIMELSPEERRELRDMSPRERRELLFGDEGEDR